MHFPTLFRALALPCQDSKKSKDFFNKKKKKESLLLHYQTEYTSH